MAEFTNLSKIMEEKKKEEAKEVKFGDEKTSVTPEEAPEADFAFGDEPSGISKQGTGFTFPEGIGSGLTREQLEELKKQAIDASNNGTGPKKL